VLLTSTIITGLGLGSMYGLIALGFHVTYVVSNTVNFSQGSAMMLGAVLGYTFAVTFGWPLAFAAVMSVLLCAVFGLVIERALVRPFLDRGSNAWLMATVAGGIVLDNAVLFTFGKEPRRFPSVLAAKPVEIFGADCSSHFITHAWARRCSRWCRMPTQPVSWGSTCASPWPLLT
jgi:branched-chain amino acid transport system permease protein